jgi:hypothetical protein
MRKKLVALLAASFVVAVLASPALARPHSGGQGKSGSTIIARD